VNKDPSPEVKAAHPRSSRKRYRLFVQDYKHGRLDEKVEASPRGKRREYLREYMRWLWPYRYAVGVVFFFALLAGGLEMVEPLFMRFIIDKILLNASLDAASRLRRLQLA
jgi:ATP-binding cassette subfamily B protein/subfamily B ATP-binding cassette protein MsbA